MKRWLLLIVVLAALGLMIYPLYVIRPFRAQGARELQAALLVARYSPVLTLALAMVGTVLAWQLWSGKGLLRKAGLGGAVLLLVLSAVATRINVYERMFNPVSSARFIPANEAKHEPNDMVMAVRLGGESRAYPVRAMAYHHVLNDVVAHEPVVATY